MSAKSNFHKTHPDYQPKNTPASMKERLAAAIDELANETDATRQSEMFKSYLTFQANFHHYSYVNQMMILSQREDATLCAGFKSWNKVGRRVKKGAKGIAIWFPSKRLISSERPDGEDETLKDYETRFYIGYVFDVSDTEGDELPEPPAWNDPDRYPVLHNAIIAAMESKGIKVAECDLGEHTRGMSKHHAVDLDPRAGTSTLIHEFTHELFHWDVRLGTEIEELQAEATTFVVMAHFGIQTPESAAYLSIKGMTAETIRTASKMIMQTARVLIDEIEAQLPEELRTPDPKNWEIAEPAAA
jgi:hypothetical protein